MRKHKSLANNTNKKKRILLEVLIACVAVGIALVVALPITFCHDKNKQHLKDATFENDAQFNKWATKYQPTLGYNWAEKTTDIAYPDMIDWINKNTDYSYCVAVSFIIVSKGSGMNPYPASVKFSDGHTHVETSDNQFRVIDCTIYNICVDIHTSDSTGAVTNFHDVHSIKAGANSSESYPIGNWFIWASQEGLIGQIIIAPYWSNLILPSGSPN